MSEKYQYVVKEGIRGTYHYHLSSPEKYTALCGVVVMQTEIPLSAWGTKTHLNERWCEKCAILAGMGHFPPPQQGLREVLD
jgi:hypothetical protein